MSRPANNIIEGRCLCGSVHFSIDAPVSPIVECHCSMCRKAAGGAFGAFFVANEKTVKWRGREHLTLYKSSPDLTRSFCKTCGTAVTGANPEISDGTIILAANMLDHDPDLPVVAVEYNSNRICWHHKADKAPCYDGAFPDWHKLRP